MLGRARCQRVADLCPGSKIAVGAVAERRILRGFALAQSQCGLFRNLELAGLNSATLVGAVAERAVACLAAGAPEIGASFEVQPCRALCCWNWIVCHGKLGFYGYVGHIVGDHFPGGILGLPGDRG